MDKSSVQQNNKNPTITFSPKLKSNMFFPNDKSPNMFLEKLKFRIDNMSKERELENDKLQL